MHDAAFCAAGDVSCWRAESRRQVVAADDEQPGLHCLDESGGLCGRVYFRRRLSGSPCRLDILDSCASLVVTTIVLDFFFINRILSFSSSILWFRHWHYRWYCRWHGDRYWNAEHLACNQQLPAVGRASRSRQ